MKMLKRWFLLLAALLLVAAGMAMPWLVSKVQDSAVETGSETRLFDPVSLTLQKGEDVQDVLRLLAGSTSELEWRGKTNLTAEDAAHAAEDAMRRLDESGLTVLIPEELAEYGLTMSVEPRMVMSMNESSLSAVIWLCWMEETPYNWIFIDDETGKIVRAFLNETWLGSWSAHSNASVTVGWDTEMLAERAELWRSFLSEYYGIEMVFAGSEDQEYDEGYGAEFSLAFDNGDGKDSGPAMRLELRGTAAYFNA